MSHHPLTSRRLELPSTLAASLGLAFKRLTPAATRYRGIDSIRW
jgi:hypothetical protein